MRCAVISDIHGNLDALEAVLADVPAGLPIWCLGDIVGYGPYPNECIDLLKSLRVECIVGNHDWAVMGKVDVRDFNPDAKLAVLWTQEQITPANLDYLENLPLSLVRGQFTLVHGSPREPIWEYILYPPVAGLNFAHFRTAHCLVGHTHVPVLFRSRSAENGGHCEMEQFSVNDAQSLRNGRSIINPGSVGQPRDGDSRASYLLLDTEELILEHRRVSYDIAKVQRRMEEVDLPRRNIARLSYGW